MTQTKLTRKWIFQRLSSVIILICLPVLAIQISKISIAVPQEIIHFLQKNWFLWGLVSIACAYHCYLGINSIITDYCNDNPNFEKMLLTANFLINAAIIIINIAIIAKTFVDLKNI